jgi:hypothetical protein
MGKSSAPVTTPAKATQQRRSQAAKRGDADKVQRLIDQHLKGCSEAILSQHIVGGNSLRGRIASARLAAESEKKNLGPTFWSALKKEYGVLEPLSELQVKDASEPVPEGLITSLEAASSPNAALRSKAPLQSYMANAPVLNQRSLVGIVKYAHTLRMTSDSSVGCMVGVMKMIVRLGLKMEFAQDCCVSANTCLALLCCIQGSTYGVVGQQAGKQGKHSLIFCRS